MKHERFHDARLSPQENKAVEMARNGFRRDEIADELEVCDNQVSVVLYNANKKGVFAKIQQRKPKACSWSTERLFALYQRGFSYTQIAERTGLTRNNVAVRLWKARRAYGIEPLRKVLPIPPERLRAWQQLRAEGLSLGEIGKKYGITRNSVWGALRRAQERSEQAA